MINSVRNLIAEQLFELVGQRATDAANQYPEVEASIDGVEAAAIPGIVLPTLEQEGFHRISGVSPNPLMQYFVARLNPETNEVIYLSITWQDDEYTSNFNPYTDIEAFTLPMADIKYIIEPQP